MLVVLLLSAWVLVAVVCAVVLGRCVRSADARRRPAVPIVLRDPPDPAADAGRRGYVQICLFDASALRAVSRPAGRQLVSPG